MRSAAAASLVAKACAFDDSGFFNWFQSELKEVADYEAKFEGTVPSYVVGQFVQTGPGRFGWGDMNFTHMLDGFSKTNTMTFSNDGSATFSAEFLQSDFYNKSKSIGHIARGMFVGGIVPDPHWGPTSVAGANDNNYIKMRKLGKDKLLLADTMIATKTDNSCLKFEDNFRSAKLSLFSNGTAWTDKLEPTLDLCMLGTMAHAAEDKATGSLIGSMGCFNPIDMGMTGQKHIVFSMDPAKPLERKALATIDLKRPPSYMHSLAETPNYIVLIAEPLYMSLPKVLEGHGLGEGGLYTNEDTTIFQIVNRNTGSVSTLEAPGFIYGHVINSWEEKNGDIAFDLTWYESNNATTLGWFNRWFLKYMSDKDIRESWPRSEVRRYTLKLTEGAVLDEALFSDEKGLDDFEVPKINEKLRGQQYCISYFMQFHSYEYDMDPQSLTSGPFGAVGLAKRNMCTGERMGWYEPNQYPSEVEFVANPSGTAEDDGALLGIVFDGNTNLSYFHILDAKTMKQVAKAPLPIKTPFLVHSSFFPDEGVETVIV